MSITLETLILEFAADFEKFEAECDRASIKAREMGKRIEGIGNAKIIPKVDHTELYQLNKHLDIKLDHVKRLNRDLKSNPITPVVNDEALRQLKKQLSEIKSIALDIRVPNNLVVTHRYEDRLSNTNRDLIRVTEKSFKQLDNSISKGFSQAQKGNLLGALFSPITTLVKGLFMEIGAVGARRAVTAYGETESGHKVISELDKASVRVAKVLESQVNTFASVVGGYNPKKNPAQKLFQDTLSLYENVADPKLFSQNAVTFRKAVAKNLYQLETGQKSLDEVLVNAAREVQTKFRTQVNNAVFRVGQILASPLLLKNEVELHKSAKKAQALQTKKVGGVEQERYSKITSDPSLKDKENITLVVGGFQKEKGRASIETAKMLEPFFDEKTAFIPVKNTYTDRAANDTKSLLNDQIIKMFGSNPMGSEGVSMIMNIEKLLGTSIKGVNPDAVRMAAIALAIEKKHPGKNIQLAGFSGGGYIVEEAIAILETLGKTNIKGVGLGSPLMGLTNRASAENYTALVGKTDPLAFPYSTEFAGEYSPSIKKVLKGFVPDGFIGQGIVTPPSNTAFLEDYRGMHDVQSYLASLEGLKTLAGQLKGFRNLKLTDAQIPPQILQHPKYQGLITKLSAQENNPLLTGGVSRFLTNSGQGIRKTLDPLIEIGKLLNKPLNKFTYDDARKLAQSMSELNEGISKIEQSKGSIEKAVSELNLDKTETALFKDLLKATPQYQKISEQLAVAHAVKNEAAKKFLGYSGVSPDVISTIDKKDLFPVSNFIAKRYNDDTSLQRGIEYYQTGQAQTKGSYEFYHPSDQKGRVDSSFKDFITKGMEPLIEKLPKGYQATANAYLETLRKLQKAFSEFVNKGTPISQELLAQSSQTFTDKNKLLPVSEQKIDTSLQVDQEQIRNDFRLAQRRKEKKQLLEAYKLNTPGFSELENIGKGFKGIGKNLKSETDIKVIEKSMVMIEQYAVRAYQAIAKVKNAASPELARSIGGYQSIVTNTIEQINKLAQSLGIEKRINLEKPAKVAGSALDQGLALGIIEDLNLVEQASVKLAQIPDKKITEINEIKSPSRRTRRSGRDIGKGYYLGLLDELPNIEKASTLLADVTHKKLILSTQQELKKVPIILKPEVLTSTEVGQQDVKFNSLQQGRVSARQEVYLSPDDLHRYDDKKLKRYDPNKSRVVLTPNEINAKPQQELIRLNTINQNPNKQIILPNTNQNNQALIIKKTQAQFLEEERLYQLKVSLLNKQKQLATEERILTTQELSSIEKKHQSRIAKSQEIVLPQSYLTERDKIGQAKLNLTSQKINYESPQQARDRLKLEIANQFKQAREVINQFTRELGKPIVNESQVNQIKDPIKQAQTKVINVITQMNLLNKQISEGLDSVEQNLKTARQGIEEYEASRNKSWRGAKVQTNMNRVSDNIQTGLEGHRESTNKWIDELKQNLENPALAISPQVVGMLKIAATTIDGIINQLPNAGKALSALDDIIQKASGNTISLGRVARIAAGGFLLFKGAELLLQPLLFSLQNIPFTIQQKMSEAILSIAEFRRFEINLSLTGTGNVRDELDGFIAHANELGIVFKQSLKDYTQFKIITTNSPLQSQSENIFSGIQDALAQRQSSRTEQQSTFKALTQIASRPKISLEEFTQQLTETGGLQDALVVASRSMGLTTSEFYRQAEAGKLLVQDVLPKMTAEYKRMSAAGLEVSKTSLQAEMNRFQNMGDQLSITTGASLEPFAKAGLQAINALLKLLNDNLTLVSAVGGAAFISVLVAMGGLVKDFVVTTRLGTIAIASWNTALVASGVGLRNTLTGMQTLKASYALFDATVSATLLNPVFLGLTAGALALVAAFKIANAGSKELRDNLESLKATQRSLNELTKPQQEKTSLKLTANSNPFTSENLKNPNAEPQRKKGIVEQIATFSPLRTATMTAVQNVRLGFRNYEIIRDLKQIDQNFDVAIQNAVRFQEVLGDTQKLKKFRTELESIQSELVLQRALREKAVTNEDDAGVKATDTRISDLQTQEAKLIDTTFKDLGSRITSDLKTQQDALANLNDKYAKGTIDVNEYTNKSSNLKSIIRILEQDQLAYNQALSNTSDQYRKLASEASRLERILQNNNFMSGLVTAKNQVAITGAYARGETFGYQNEITSKRNNLDDVESRSVNLKLNTNALANQYEKNKTNTSEDLFNTYFSERERKGLGFSEALKAGYLSPESINQMVSDKQDDLSAKQQFLELLKNAAKQAQNQKDQLELDKQIAQTQADLRDAIRQRAIRERQVGNETVITQKRAALFEAMPLGGRQFNINSSVLDLENYYLQLGELSQQLTEKSGDPLEIQSQVNQITGSIAQTKANIIQQQYEIQEYYIGLDRQIYDFNIQLRNYSRQLEDTKLTDFRGVRSLNNAYQDLTRNLDKQLIDLGNQLANAQDKLASSQLRSDLTKNLTPGVNSYAKQLTDIFTGLVDEQNNILSEKRTFKSQAEEVETNYIQTFRQIVTVQDQQVDLERQRKRAIEDTKDTQISLNSTLASLIRQTNKELGFIPDSVRAIVKNLDEMPKPIQDINSALNKLPEGITGAGNGLVGAIDEITKKISEQINSIGSTSSLSSFSLPSAFNSSGTYNQGYERLSEVEQKLNQNQAFANNAIARSVALMITAGESGSGWLKQGSNTDLIKSKGGAGNKMQGFAQFNTDYFNPKNESEYIDLLADMLTGKRNLPTGQGKFDTAKLERLVKTGKIKTEEQLLKYVQSQIPIMDWHGLHESGGGANRIRQSGVLSSALKLIQGQPQNAVLGLPSGLYPPPMLPPTPQGLNLAPNVIPPSNAAKIPPSQKRAKPIPPVSTQSSPAGRRLPSFPQLQSSNYDFLNPTQLYAGGISDIGMYESPYKVLSTEKFAPNLLNLPAFTEKDLTPLPKLDFKAALDQASQIKQIQTEIVKINEENNKLAQEALNFKGKDQLRQLMIGIEDATRNFVKNVKDSELATFDLISNAKGYLTVTEQINKAERDTNKEYDDRIFSLKDQITQQERLFANASEQLADIKGELAKSNLSPEIREEFLASEKRLQSQYEQSAKAVESLNNQVQSLEATRATASENAKRRAKEDLDLRSLQQNNGLYSEFYSRKADFANPFAAIGLRKQSARLRIDADYASRELDLRRQGQEQNWNPYQLTENLNVLQQMKDMDLSTAFVEANPFAQEMQNLMQGIVDSGSQGFKNLGDVALQSLKSILAMLSQIFIKMAVMKIFGAIGGGAKGGFQVGSGSGFGATGGSFTSPNLGSGFSGATTALKFNDGGEVPNFIKNFNDGGIVPKDIQNFATGGEIFGLGASVYKAMLKEGTGAVPIVAHAGEQVLTDKNGDAQLWRALQRDGRWDEMKTQNFDMGGIVSGGGASSSYSSGSGSRRGNVTQPINVHNTWNISTPDADSFRKSQSQQLEEAERRNRRAMQRNG